MAQVELKKKKKSDITEEGKKCYILQIAIKYANYY